MASEVQSDQVLDVANIDDTSVEEAMRSVYDGYTVLDEEDVPLACIGVSEIDEHNCTAWAIFKDDIGLRFFDIHRAVKLWLDSEVSHDYEYIWANVRQGFEEGNRWVSMLGFTRYNTVPNYYLDGENANIYVRERM